MKIFCSQLLLLTVCSSSFESASCYIDLPIVLKYFKFRSITSLNAFLCKSQDILDIFGQGKESNAHFITSVVSNVSNSSEGNAPLKVFKAQSYTVGVIFDLGCSSSHKILEMVSNNRLLNGSFAFAIMSDETLNKTLNFLEPMGIAFDSDITLFVNTTLYDLYRTAKPVPIMSMEVGRWTEDGELVVSVKPPRVDLGGALLNAKTVVKEFDKNLFGKKEFFDSHYLTSVDALSRFPCKLHTYVEFLMNFKTNLTSTPDWGYYNEQTGKFDKVSLYGELEQGKTEFGLALSWMFSARLYTSLFTPVTHHMSSCVVFRHPEAGASFNAFARPFTSITWLVVFLFVLIGSVCLYTIRRWDFEVPPSNEKQYSTSFFHVTSVMCLQGSYIESSRIPTRVLSVFLQVMALMLYSYYGAEILGFLLSPTPRTITTVKKLVDSHMDLWAEDVSFHRNHFRAALNAKSAQYYQLGIKRPTPDKEKFIDRLVGLKLVQHGGAAMYGLTPNLYENIQQMYTSPEICSLYFMDMLYIKTAIPVQKQSPYREMYFKSTLRILENGLRDYEERKWHAQKPPCVGTEANSAVKLEATFIALMIYTTGFLMAMLFFIIEWRVTSRRMVKICRIPYVLKRKILKDFVEKVK